MFSYPVTLTPAGGIFLVTSPDFPDVTGAGASREEALRSAETSFSDAIARRIDRGLGLPVPSADGIRVWLPTQTALKALVYQAMRRENVSRLELARRLQWQTSQVNSLLDLTHASRIDEYDAAFHALGRRISVGTISE